MGLPAKLKNYNLFADGDSWLGETSEVALPKIAKKVEAWRGGGMLAEVDIEMGLDKLEMETKIGGLSVSAMRAFGAVGVAGSALRYVGAYQEDGAGVVSTAELAVRCQHVELDPGNAKVGDNTEWSLKSTLSYLKWTVNGVVEIEIDVLNCVMVIDGVDRMAAIRAAMGL